MLILWKTQKTQERNEKTAVEKVCITFACFFLLSTCYFQLVESTN